MRHRQFARLPGGEQGAVRQHVGAGQKLEPAHFLDLADGTNELADEGVGEEREAVFLLVVGAEDRAHVLEVQR